MPSYKTYSTEQYIKFLKNKITSNFGLSDEELADWFMGQPGAIPVITSYGVTKKNLLSTYIPKIKEYQGEAAFFLFYTVTEGGGAGNWINHYGTDQGSNGMECLISDLEYCKTIDNGYNGYPVAMDAPEVKGTPPQENINECQNVYNSVGKSTIGSIMMPSTMAGNAWVFGEQWCLDHQGPKPPAVYFGNPYDLMIKTIKDAGVDPFAGTGSNEGVASPSNPTKPTEEKEDNSDKRKAMKEALDKMIKAIKETFNQNVYTASEQYMFNKFIKLTKNMNLWRVRLSDEALDEIKKILDDAISTVLKDTVKPSGQTGSAGSSPSKDDVEQQNKPATDRIKKALADIAAFIGGGTPGADFGSGDGGGNLESQCFALSGYFAGLMSGYTCASCYSDRFRQLSGPGTDYASKLHTAYNWGEAGAKTKDYTGIAMPASDLKVGMIFNTASNYNGPTGSVDGGGQAYLQTIKWGHTGVIESFTDTTVTTIEQNAYLANSPIPNRRVARITYPRDPFLNSVSGVVWWD